MWIKGPPLKPVLCNACGSHWRTKGTLELYVPKRKQNNVAIDESDNLTSSYEEPNRNGNDSSYSLFLFATRVM